MLPTGGPAVWHNPERAAQPNTEPTPWKPAFANPHYQIGKSSIKQLEDADALRRQQRAAEAVRRQDEPGVQGSAGDIARTEVAAQAAAQAELAAGATAPTRRKTRPPEKRKALAPVTDSRPTDGGQDGMRAVQARKAAADTTAKEAARHAKAASTLAKRLAKGPTNLTVSELKEVLKTRGLSSTITAAERGPDGATRAIMPKAVLVARLLVVEAPAEPSMPAGIDALSSTPGAFAPPQKRSAADVDDVEHPSSTHKQPRVDSAS